MRALLIIILASFSAAAYSASQINYQLTTVAEGLNYPWSVAFLPNGNYLITQRKGDLLVVTPNGKVNTPFTNTPKTYSNNQGGFFDVVLDPNYIHNRTLYLSFAHGTTEANATRIIKATLAETSIENVTPIFTVTPLKDTPAHYGGRMAFLNDGTLVMSTGDGFEYREAAQDKFSQLGKLVRLKTDGSVPTDNPFADGENGNPYVYSYGHRNPQGLVFDAANNKLYMHEHGPKGGDEINIIEAAGNYGWPAATHGINYSGALVSPYQRWSTLSDPIKVWTPSIAPSGLALYNGEAFPNWNGSLFVGALLNQDVRRIELHDGKVTSEETLFTEIGERIRDIRQGPDGFLYILTDSEQGRLIRVSPVD